MTGGPPRRRRAGYALPGRPLRGDRPPRGAPVRGIVALHANSRKTPRVVALNYLASHRDAGSLLRRRRRLGLRRYLAALAVCVAGLALAAATAQAAEIEVGFGDSRQPLVVSAERAVKWRHEQYEIWVLRGRCQIEQGATTARASEAVLWVERTERPTIAPHRMIAYLEGGVTITGGGAGTADRGSQARVSAANHRREQPLGPKLTDRQWLGRFHSAAGVHFRVGRVRSTPAQAPPILARANAARDRESRAAVRLAQFTQPELTQPETIPPPAATLAPGSRTVEVFPRGGVPIEARFDYNPQTDESIAVVTSGVNIVARDGNPQNTIDVSTDRLVMWGKGRSLPDFSGKKVQPSDIPLELYLEGNIVFRQGNRVIYAERMYYNVASQRGIVLDAEILTPIAQYEGLLRLKAKVIQQLDASNFVASKAALTSSRLGVPRYWLQSETITYRDRQRPRINPFTGVAEFDPETGEQIVEHDVLATSNQNLVYVAGAPVFYWPTLAATGEESSFYIERVRIKSDSVFGAQLLTDFNMQQLLGIEPILPNGKWLASVDLLSDRGIALGTEVRYSGDRIFGIAGPFEGFLDAWGIKDDGLDNLGRDRAMLPLAEDIRGRILARHRHQLPWGIQLKSEFGVVSDRNFLEQYYEQEWDEFKDQTTGAELKRIMNHTAWALATDVRLNDFFAQTEGIRLDHYTLGHSLLQDQLTWFEHSQIGYLRLGTAEPSPFAATPAEGDDPTKDPSVPLPWETSDGVTRYDNRSGVRAVTRHEIDYPFELGPAKLVPYALAEAGYWGEDRMGDDLTRTYGQLGLRASTVMWKADPTVQDQLFNLNGLAHKVTYDFEFLWAEASQDLDRFPLYDPLDDDSIEAFRRRFFISSGPFFGASPALAARIDERVYARRAGLQSWVSSPSAEIADDLMFARFGVRQRWQTRRGLPGQERTVDWIALDVEGVIFPKADRDNFGEEFGLVDYDFRWHIGDRLTLLSDGYFDFFSDGLRVVTFGGRISRPGRGSLYLGFRSIEGPISSNVVAVSINYRMSEKWIANFGTSIDFGETGNIGQSIDLVRIGESFLVQFGINVDEGRDNVGVRLAIQPRFLKSSKLGRVAGVQVPPAGAFGLE